MNVTAVRMGEDPKFVAHIFRGDSTDLRRVWVCLRGEVDVARRGWIACWSSKSSAPSAPDVERFIRQLAEKIHEGGRTGPMGPFLSGHYFFDEWDAWGIGTPQRILSMTPSFVISVTPFVTELQNFVYRD